MPSCGTTLSGLATSLFRLSAILVYSFFFSNPTIFSRKNSILLSDQSFEQRNIMYMQLFYLFFLDIKMT